MIRLVEGDLIAISSGSRLHYALILGNQVLFGGNPCYLFHATSKEPRDAAYFMAERRGGFHAIVDFVRAKRDCRVRRIAKGLDTAAYAAPGLFKWTFADDSEKAKTWSILDSRFRELKRTRKLSPTERRLPDAACYEVDYALKLARRKWVPGADPRI